MKTLESWYERNRKLLLFAMISTFLWGMMAHGYCFFDNSVSHDALNEFHAAIFGNEWKMQLGRVFTPLYRDLLRGDATLPWLIGVLALLWLGLATFVVCKIFCVESRTMAALIAGVLTVNITVSANAATYVNDLDSNMLSLLFAVAAVYCWKCLPWGELPGAVLLMGCMGIYQGFLAVAIVLVMFVSILELFRGTWAKQVFVRGLRAVGMVLLGGGLYFVAMKAITALSGVTLASGEYNSLGKALELTPQTLLGFVIGAYGDWFQRLWNAYSSYPAILVRLATALLFAITALAMGVFFLDKKRGIWEKLLALVLFALLPLVMNLYYVLTLDNNHDLMVYAIWLSYLLVMLLSDWLLKKWKGTGKKEKLALVIHILCLLLVFMTVYGSVQFANGMYLKKDIEYDAYLSLMTRVVGRMEGFPGYVVGQTPVVFVGLPQTLNYVIPGFKEYQNVIGMQFSDVLLESSPRRYQAYFDYVLNTPVNLAEGDRWMGIAESDAVSQMPCYPEAGFLQMVEDTLVVKLSQNSDE